MDYETFTTFGVSIDAGVAAVTFDYPPVNIQGLPMLADLNTLAQGLEADEIGPFVDALAKRIALWPLASINATKQAVYESIDRPIADALRAEAYWLYQATSQTPALKRFKWADEQGAQFDMDNQRSWPEMLVQVQEVND